MEQNKEFEHKICEMLQKEFYVHPEHNGFDYLVHAIIETSKKDKRYPMMTGVYLDVAHKFNTTVSRVERCIRYAIENSKLVGMPNRAVIYKLALLVKYDKQ